MSGLRLTNGTTTVVLDDPSLTQYAVMQYSPRSPEADATGAESDADGGEITNVRYKNVINEPCKVFFQNTLAGLQAVLGTINALFEDARTGRLPVYLELKVDDGGPWWRSQILYGRATLNEQVFAPWQMGSNGYEPLTSYKWLLLDLEWTRRYYWEGAEAQLELTNGNLSNTHANLPVYNHDDGDTGGGHHDNWWTVAASAITGDLPAPVRLQMLNSEPNAVDTVYLGRSSKANTYGTNLQLESSAATVTGGSTVADSDSSGGSVADFGVIATPQVVAQWTLSKALLTATAGQWYRVMMRLSNATPGTIEGLRSRISIVGNVTLLHRTQWVTAPDDPALTAFQLHDLGAVQLPPGLINPASPRQLTLQLEMMREVGTSVRLDFLYLMPMESARTLVPKGYNTPNGTTLIDDGLSDLVYTFDGTDQLPNYIGYGGPLMIEPGRRNTYYALFDNDLGASEPNRFLMVKMFYRPRRLLI